MTETVNNILAVLTVVAQLGVGFLLVSYFLYRKDTERPAFLKLVESKAMLIAFVVVLVAVSGSLFYSEVAGYEPCKLCWLQRIFLYPQLLLLGMAMKKKDKGMRDYSLVLSVIGAIIAAYHYYIQLGGNPLIPCSTVGYSVSCAERFVMSFGYITIPMMALSAFLLMIAVFTWQKISERSFGNSTQN